MNIAIVEDDFKLGAYYDEIIKKEGINTYLCTTRSEFLDIFTNDFKIDIIVLDRLIENIDSTDYIKEIKSKYRNIKILVLSAINSGREKAYALDKGADYYLTKPVSSEELMATIRVLMRSSRNEYGAQFYTLGNLVLDTKSKIITSNGKRIDLTHKELLILQILIQSPGKIFSRIQLMDLIWDTESETVSNVVESCVKNLRKKLELSKANVSIENKRNIGYWIED